MTYSEKLGGEWVPAPAGWRVRYDLPDGDVEELDVVGWLTEEDGEITPLVWHEASLGVRRWMDLPEAIFDYQELLGPSHGQGIVANA
ncbi:hypothetical protein EAS64_33660 [Trebonia kvetii]|uniref:Uncharacterized protein n=1 Tax=Trebonia kvetii TaxID=2480626 RepID=A0A6P2BQU1_9ACTN|nr:hypothetical protein [Trebonia kvetii]TVZ01228.1 hypothetical protein EAS64_33660 [Trebonia kvetii]